MSLADCTCERVLVGRAMVRGIADEDCPEHGLRPGVKFPPMDRHAREGEDARDAQRRLYLAAASDRIRVEAAGFRWPLRRCPPREGPSQR